MRLFKSLSSCAFGLVNTRTLVAAFGVLTFGVLSGCGVKGDPLPPEKPLEIGRGRPTYKKATEGIRIDRTKQEPDRDADKDEDEETE